MISVCLCHSNIKQLIIRQFKKKQQFLFNYFLGMLIKLGLSRLRLLNVSRAAQLFHITKDNPTYYVQRRAAQLFYITKDNPTYFNETAHIGMEKQINTTMIDEVYYNIYDDQVQHMSQRRDDSWRFIFKHYVHCIGHESVEGCCNVD